MMTENPADDNNVSHWNEIVFIDKNKVLQFPMVELEISVKFQIVFSKFIFLLNHVYHRTSRFPLFILMTLINYCFVF